MDYKEKNCLVIGASSGLGLAIAKQFAALGANTILVCRNKQKGKKALIEIESKIQGASVQLMICDLTSLKSIQGFVKEFKAKYTKLDILYNNAAVMKNKRNITEDGLEMMFQVNFLAPFIFMNSFLELLKNSTAPYIINNLRPADKYRLDLNDLQFSQNYSMFDSFFKTKLCLLFTTLEFSRREESNGVTVTMIDPGPFKSDLVGDVPLARFLKNLFSAPVNKAVENILYHITSDKAEKASY